MSSNNSYLFFNLENIENYQKKINITKNPIIINIYAHKIINAYLVNLFYIDLSFRYLRLRSICMVYIKYTHTLLFGLSSHAIKNSSET